MTATLIESLANAWRERLTLDADPWHVSDEAEAYAVHDGLIAALGWQPPGQPQYWKSGGASRSVRLAHSPLAPAGVRYAPANFADLALRQPIIEAEIALRTGVALSTEDVARLTPETADSVIDALCVSVEWVTSRWQQAGAAPALLRMADCQNHGALALGDWQPYQRRDWSKQSCSLQINAGEVLRGTGCHPLGDPAWGLLPWLKHATRHGTALPAASVVTTGAWLIVKGLKAGDRAALSFDGIGAVEVRI